MSEGLVFAGVEPADPIDVEDVKPLACRGCLAVSRPLRPLERATAALYGELVGTAVSVFDMYPKFVCLYCRALLLKFKAFRDKCRSSQNTFSSIHSAGIPINSALFESGVAGAPYPKLETTRIPNISLLPEIQPECGTKSNNMEPKGMNELSRLGMSIKIDSTGLPSLCIDKTNNSHPESISSLAKKIIKPLNTEKKLVEISNAPNYYKFPQSSSSRKKIKMDHDYFEFSNADRSKDNDGDVLMDTIDTASVNNYTRVTREELLSLLDEADKLLSKHNTVSKRTPNENVNLVKLTSKRNKLPDSNEKKFNVKIVELSKDEQLKEVEERKNSLKYKNSRYRCDLCYHVFRNELTLKNHMEKHDESRGHLVCKICHYRFRAIKTLRNHEAQSHTYNYICNECGVVNKSLASTVIHYKWHKGVKYDCKICGKLFDKPTSVFGHMHLSHEATEKCPICAQKCFGHKGLLAHMQFSHKEAYGAVCSSCNTQFHNVSALQRHLSVGCDVTHSPCVVCGEGFTTGQLLEEHKIQCHSESYTCGECFKRFNDKNEYKKHSIVHSHYYSIRKQKEKHEADSHICHICGITIKGPKAKLEYHHRVKHTNERPYQCDYCQKRFALKHLLMTHVIGHMNKIQGNIKCRYCDQTFTLTNNRDRHVNAVHKKLTPFECHLCGKAFNVKTTMLNHVKHSHEGVPWPKRIDRARGWKRRNASLVRQETSLLETDPSGNGEEQSFEAEPLENDFVIICEEEAAFYEED